MNHVEQGYSNVYASKRSMLPEHASLTLFRVSPEFCGRLDSVSWIISGCSQNSLEKQLIQGKHEGDPGLTKVAREQEIGNSFLYLVFMPTIATHHLAFPYLGFYQ